ncbi:response regulator transcription factor [Massilia atriviolacea]|uniref:Response regulator transcription factor n=1 Tax=Massilia atriviolacea TaxID=2495579 RepID=A0A430HSV7_9BURK|nr:response regulator transcription factor [Massilia atriviolacea]RSZ60628.1 response regulator transcription factor [Massilia atriviolacea]
MSAEHNPIRVLLADDHSLLREGIVALLSGDSAIEIVGQAANGEEAVERFIALRPDVTLMDLQMPLMDGHDAMLAMRALDLHARVLVLTTYKGDARIARALGAGAAGYLLKCAIRLNLADAIHRVHAGHRYIPAEVAAEMANYFGSDKLSGRELEVLRLVADGNSNREVGVRLAIKEETVKAHVSAVLSKLGARDRTHATTIALRRGILTL